jgi:nicotinic acid mononucleotide adenylyltransferase
VLGRKCIILCEVFLKVVAERQWDVAEVARSIELYSISKRIHELGKKGIPRLVFTREPFFRDRKEVDRVVVAAGSYDPLTVAHVSLFRKGLEAARESSGRDGLDETLVLTSTAHFEKDVNLRENAAIYDRVHAQEGFARCEGNVSLGFFNRALFVDMAGAVRESYPNSEIYFLAGIDVMQKVLDPEGYRKIGLDPDEMQKALFDQSCFVVSQRAVKTEEGEKVITLEDLQARYPDSLKYADRMIPFDLGNSYSDLEIPIEEVSSTLIRNRRNAHEGIGELVAVGISQFVDKRSLYLSDSDRYAAFVCARQRFADEHPDEPISNYIGDLMNYLERLDEDPVLRSEEVRNYCKS